MKWESIRSVNVGFAFACATLLVVDLVAYFGLTRQIETAARLSASQAVLGEVAEILEHLQNAETGQRGYLLTGDDRYLQPYHAATMELDRDMSQLRVLSRGSPEHLPGIDALGTLMHAKLEELADTVEARRVGGLEGALSIVRTDRGKRLMDEIRVRLRSIEAAERATLVAGVDDGQRLTSSTTIVLGIGSALSILMIAVAALVSHRELARRREAELALQAARDALELRVAERTAALASTNSELVAEADARRSVTDALADSQHRYQRLFEATPVGVCHYDGASRVIMVNAALARILGVNAASVEGIAVVDLFGVDQLPAQGSVREVSRARADGATPTERWIAFRAVPLDDGGLIVAEDVTARRRMERRRTDLMHQLEQGRDNVASVLDQLRVGIALVDEAGCVTFVSETAERMLGRDREAIVNAHWRKALGLSADDLRRMEAALTAPAGRRGRVTVRRDEEGCVPQTFEIEVQDDRRDASRRMVFFHDVSDVQALRRLLDEKSRFEGLVGRSAAMQLVYQRIRELGAVETTVLIEGETGTGKELVACAIHATSPRRDRPFVAVNCAGLTESLLSSQLFGHRRGAFTGAVHDHKGFFEAADGGTLFLDEIGDLPPPLQAGLLRALQEREIVRLGESLPRKIDVRILAATHQDLSRAAADGRFRSDLLYRIRVARIEIPPLRERVDDLVVLATHFLAECRASTGRPVQDIGPAALRALADHDWPGNVRELRSAIECAVIRSAGTSLAVEDLPREILESRRSGTHARPGDSPDRSTVLEVLAATGGNRTETARRLGISRATLYRRLALPVHDNEAPVSHETVG